MPRIGAHLRAGQIVVSATKGVEDHTSLRMTRGSLRHSRAELGACSLPIGALSGPSFALEVAQGQPTAVTVAFSDPPVAALIQQEFSSETLRLYTSTDVIGVELGGALKNVIAIAAGIAAGVGLGHNSAAALITRGIVEITRLAVACGAAAKPSPASPAWATWCSPAPARSAATARLARRWARAANCLRFSSRSAAKWPKACCTTRAALGLARKHGIEMPITEQMELILNEGKDPREAIRDLMLRPGKDERSDTADYLFTSRISTPENAGRD